ncbi:MAG: hypothetical protein WBR18_06665 [Anaerolineales bacterium]
MRKLPLAWLLAAALIAFGVGSRISQLGASPLSPPEAASALGAVFGTDQASPFWQGALSAAPTATSYLISSRMAMTWFGATKSTARAVPALAGIGLLLLPLLLVRRWGWLRVLLTITLLLISPTVSTLSRTAGSTVLAALGLVLVLVAMVRARGEGAPSSGLIAVGLAIGAASGAPFWMGVFGLLLAGLLALALERGRQLTLPVSRRFSVGLLGAAGLLLAGGTLLGADWSALAGTISGPGEWLRGWAGGGYPWTTALAMVPIYEPLALLGAAVGTVRAIRADRIGSPAAYWAMGAVLAYLLYPGRTPADLIWFVLPAAALTASWILDLVEQWRRLEQAYPATLLALVILTILVFAAFNWQSTKAGFGLGAQDYSVQLGFVISAVGFSLALVLLFGIGWSWRETGLAAAAVIAFGLAATTLSSAWGLTLGQSDSRVDLWRPQTSTANLQLLEKTVQSIANAHVGRAGGLPIGTTDPLPANLAWALRQQQPALLGSQADPPPVVIATVAAGEPALPADYLGQAFGITQSWDWVGALPPSFDRWLSGRRAPTRLETWVLYVRTDVAGLEGDLIDGVQQ